MIVRKLRLQRGWSQEQLAAFSGLNIRTIQRIERGQNASLESLKSLAAVFDVDIHDLKAEPTMNPEPTLSIDEQQALEHVRDIKAFYSHLITYVVTISFLFFMNIMFSPEYIWAIWPAFGWGIGISVHGLCTFEVFNLFGPEWERKQVEKRLNKKKLS